MKSAFRSEALKARSRLSEVAAAQTMLSLSEARLEKA